MTTSDTPSTERATELRGGWVVAAMVALAALSTTVLWTYWKLHLGPFVPLQKAIVAEFEDSAPRVEGGQRKMHEDTPVILRVVMSVDFDPHAEEARIDRMTDRVIELARENVDLERFDQIDIFFFQRLPEERIVERKVSRKLPDGGPVSSERTTAPSTVADSP